MTPLLIGLAGLGLWRAANAEIHRFERLAAEEITAKLAGEARKVTIRANAGPEAIFGDVHRVTLSATRFEANGLPLYTEPKRSHAGSVSDFEIDLSDFTLRGLHVARLRASIPDCRFDLPLAVRHHNFRLSRSGEGTGEVVVAEQDLQSFILAKFHGVKDIVVHADRDKLFIEGRADILMLSANFALAARLMPDHGRLLIRYPHLSLNGQPAGEAMVQVLTNFLNPVVDLNRDLGLAGAMDVDRLVLRDGLIRATGRIRIPTQPSETTHP